MKRTTRHILFAAVAVAVLGIAVSIWFGAVDRWIAHQLRALAANHLAPRLDFDDLSYHFPRSVSLRGVRLTSPDPDAPNAGIEILAVRDLTLVLAGIPMPEAPFRMERLELGGPTLRLVRSTHAGGGWVGFSQLFKKSGPSSTPDPPRAQLSDYFEIRAITIADGSWEFDPRGSKDTLMRVEGIRSTLSLTAGQAGAYQIDFALHHKPIFEVALRGTLQIDSARLDATTLSASVELGREQDHYLTPSVQHFLSARDVSGRARVRMSGDLDLRGKSSHLRAEIEMDDAGYSFGDYRLTAERVESTLALAAETWSVDKLSIDALGGHADVHGSISRKPGAEGTLFFEGSDFQIGDLARHADDRRAAASLAGLLDFRGTLRGPFSELDHRAAGDGRLSLRKARLARLPLLSNIDEALDRAAEAVMLREKGVGHDELSLKFRFDGDRTHLSKVRMNSRWYGLRGHGDIFFDSRIDLIADAGPVQRLANELGPLGDVMGEITETILRAHARGTLGDPKVRLEVLRHSLVP